MLFQRVRHWWVSHRRSDLPSVLDETWLIGRLIAFGGMGNVWEGTRLLAGDKVAIKLARSTSDPLAEQRFGQEARLLSEIKHPHLCPVVAWGTHKGKPYLVMPLLEGESLAECLRKRSEPIKLTRAIHISTQILGGLQALHEQGVVHRDLKPSNIFLSTETGREEIVKILDLGISKHIGNTKPLRRTTGNIVLGTAYYMAPERIGNEQTIRTDIYAVGAILYEMLTQKQLYEGAPQEVLKKLARAKGIKLPRHINPSIPAELEEIILIALARDPEDRFSSANDMRGALEFVSDRLADSAGASLAGTDSTGASTSAPSKLPRTRDDIRTRITSGY